MKVFKFFLILTSFSCLFIVVAENRLDSNEQKLHFNEIFILESERDEGGRYINGDLVENGFTPYDWSTLPVPEGFTDRMYTLRAQFFLNNSLSGDVLALYLGPSEYPYNVYLNGELLAERGNDRRNTYFSIFTTAGVMIPERLLNPGSWNSLAIQAFPGKELHALSGIYLAAHRSVTGDVYFRNLLNIKFIQAVFFLAVILSVYFMFIFITRKTHDMKYVFFALMSLFYAINSVNIAFFYNYADGLVLAKLSRIGLPMTTAFLCMFVIAFTGILDKRFWVKLIILIPAILFALVTVLLKTKYAVYAFFTDYTSNYIILPLLIFSMVLLIISAIKYKNRNSIYIIIAFVFVMAASVHDLGYLNAYRIPYFWTVPYGFTLLVLSIFFVLANEEATVHTRLIDREQELNSRNDSMKRVIENVKKVSVNLTSSYQRLEKLIDQAVGVITQYERSNNILKENAENRSRDISMIISSLTARFQESNKNVPRAIISQVNVMEEISSTIQNMNNDLEITRQSSSETNIVARELAELAQQSSIIITESKTHIGRIAEYSHFITQVLTSIEDITERTKILSINAAIEAVRAGQTGRGFSVIAQEVRKLARISQSNLESSFTNIGDIQKTLNQSTSLADKVTGSLFRIIESSKKSAAMIDTITDNIQQQKSASSSILESGKLFSSGTETIKLISEKEIGENTQIQTTLRELQATFQSIIEQMNRQMDKREEFQAFLDNVNQVMSENLKNIDILNDCIEREVDV